LRTLSAPRWLRVRIAGLTDVADRRRTMRVGEWHRRPRAKFCVRCRRRSTCLTDVADRRRVVLIDNGLRDFGAAIVYEWLRALARGHATQNQ
jgi:hypothetical protein